ncbi:MAG: trehalose-6-phosphate synthase [Candidatus Omnitrophica bacterium]|nr:trehalose-6-phosphate synthase [Candidatus Omnitrophota bacterium]
MWTKDSLREVVEERLGDYLLIVASNREPYVHTYRKSKIVCQRSAGGVVTALDPVLKACSGLWVAHGSGDADKKTVDQFDKLQVPPDDPKYTLHRVWLTKEEEDGYYYGFSNEALWPLSHISYTRPKFEELDWEMYEKVNRKFADAILKEIGDRKAFVWIQDYHMALLPKFLKEAKGNNIITAHFWHIPWPNPEVFRICPKRTQILEGLLANDLLGFHIRYHCENFISTVEKEIEARVDRERFSIIKGGHETIIRPFPIGVDYEHIDHLSQSREVEEYMQSLREEFLLNYEFIMLGLDRIDYTKGIPERLRAVDRFLEKYPEYKGRFVLIQMGRLSRLHIPVYKNLNDEINALVEEINWKHSQEGWAPILFVRRHLSYPEVIAFCRLANICIVSSLHDGMNLVAKEYVSARTDGTGVLVLSQFTGSSRELEDAVMINPYDTEDFSEKIKKAITMDKKEANRRIIKMREKIALNNVYKWAGKILSELLKFEFKE